MSYLAVKNLHILCVLLSAMGFALRGWGRICHADWMGRTWVRVWPHVVDSVLLLSAVVLAVWSGQYPGQQAWLSAKVLGLLLYIALGHWALRGAQRRSSQILAVFLALSVLAYMASVAVYKSPTWML